MQGLIAVMGVLVTLMVVVGMVLMTPGNTVVNVVESDQEAREPLDVV